MPQIRKCHFWSDPSFFLHYLLRKGAYRDISHISFKAHTISNKLTTKVSAQKKGEGVMTAIIFVQISVVSGGVPS